MKRIQWIFFISIGIGLIGLGIPLYLMFWGPEHLEFTNKTIKEIFAGEDWIPIAVVTGTIIIVAVSLIPFIRIIFPPQIKNGEKAKATIIKVWDTGTTINDDPQIGLLLEAITKEGQKFHAETKTIVSRLNVAMVQPGVTAEVIYDPANTKRVQVISIETTTGNDDSVEKRLMQILDLREKGLLSEEEYQKKREEIVKSI
jgi:hypothetical protein